jgi:hypothetical protein
MFSTVSSDMIHKRILRTGDGSHKYAKLNSQEEEIMAFVQKRMFDDDGNHIHHEGNNVWGWDDPAMKDEDKKYAKVVKW